MTPPNWHWEKNDDHHEDYDHRYIYHDHFTIISPGGSHLGCCWENGLHHHYYQACNNLSWSCYNDLTRLESSRLALESEQEIQRDRLLKKVVSCPSRWSWFHLVIVMMDIVAIPFRLVIIIINALLTIVILIRPDHCLSLSVTGWLTDPCLGDLTDVILADEDDFSV